MELANVLKVRLFFLFVPWSDASMCCSSLKGQGEMLEMCLFSWMPPLWILWIIIHWNICRSKHIFLLYLIICESQAVAITELSELLFRNCSAVGGVQVQALWWFHTSDLKRLPGSAADAVWFQKSWSGKGSGFSPLIKSPTQGPVCWHLHSYWIILQTSNKTRKQLTWNPKCFTKLPPGHRL